VQVTSGPEGVTAATASQDMGNGTRTAIAYAVAGVLGVPPSEIAVRVGDSRDVHGPMSAGSRTTSSVVPAAEEATRALRGALTDFAIKHFRLVDARAVDGGIAHASGRLSWREVLQVAPKQSFVGRRRRDKGGYLLPFSVGGLSVSKYLSGGVQVTEVEVDTRLGRVRVRRVWGGYGVGRIVVPELARSQAQGGIIQGLSYALYEERRIDHRRGDLLTGGLEDYRIIGIGDVPEIEIHFVEDGFDNVTGHAVGLGELVCLAPAASVANAVFHATGWRPRELPLRPDRVMAGVRA
jgi:xanthine dehydrogenase YagR molybdenum-binding subunit